MSNTIVYVGIAGAVAIAGYMLWKRSSSVVNPQPEDSGFVDTANPPADAAASGVYGSKAQPIPSDPYASTQPKSTDVTLKFNNKGFAGINQLPSAGSVVARPSAFSTNQPMLPPSTLNNMRNISSLVPRF